jgi:hypothetical protein
MKRIGLLDHSLDNFHANFLPRWIEASGRANDFSITHAFALSDSPGGCDNRRWCDERKVKWCESPEEVVDACDAIAVLAPSNPESHEQLSDAALRSGKPLFIDKTMAVSAAGARQFFEVAREYGTPVFSASALRFAQEVKAAKDFLDGARPANLFLMGPGSVEEYSVHYWEMAVMLGIGTSGRVLCNGIGSCATILAEFDDQQTCGIRIHPGSSYGLWVADDSGGGFEAMPISHDFFTSFTAELLNFFDGGPCPVPAVETIQIHELINASRRALENPGNWETFNTELKS